MHHVLLHEGYGTPILAVTNEPEYRINELHEQWQEYETDASFFEFLQGNGIEINEVDYSEFHEA